MGRQFQIPFFNLHSQFSTPNDFENFFDDINNIDTNYINLYIDLLDFTVNYEK